MQPSGKLADIQVLRAYCILITAVNHLQFLVYWNDGALRAAFAHFGFWGGVDAFFVISGFVIARSFLPSIAGRRSGEAFWIVVVAFWMRRAFRIVPSAAVWLVVPLGLSIVFGPAIYLDAWTNFHQLVSGLFQVANFHHWSMASGRAPWPANSVYWSLSLEEQFYLLLPICFALFERRFVWFCAVVALTQLFVPRVHGDFSWSIRTDGFMAGILLYYLSTTPLHAKLEPIFLRALSVRLPLVASLLCGLCVFASGVALVPFRTGMIVVIASLLVFIASYDGDYLTPGRPLSGALQWLGSRSYAIYLLHIVAFMSAHQVAVALGFAPVGLGPIAVYLIAAVVWVLVLAEVTVRLVEEPLRLKGKAIAARFALQAGE